MEAEIVCNHGMDGYVGLRCHRQTGLGASGSSRSSWRGRGDVRSEEKRPQNLGSMCFTASRRLIRRPTS